MGYDVRSRELLPFGYGDSFPAFLTKRGGLDRDIIDLMQPLHDKGLRSGALSKIILEMHTKTHALEHLQRENLLERDRRLDPTLKPGMFSAFNDKSKYDGLVPTGKYLDLTFTRFMATIKQHLDKEVKKRPANRLHIDASFKEAKHLSRYHGKPVFKALVTGTNEYNEVRLQFHVVTDGHDQMTYAFRAFKDTCAKYGQSETDLAFTDKPSGDSLNNAESSR